MASSNNVGSYKTTQRKRETISKTVLAHIHYINQINPQEQITPRRLLLSTRTSSKGATLGLAEHSI